MKVFYYAVYPFCWYFLSRKSKYSLQRSKIHILNFLGMINMCLYSDIGSVRMCLNVNVGMIRKCVFVRGYWDCKYVFMFGYLFIWGHWKVCVYI
jgi:hypothetical protein